MKNLIKNSFFLYPNFQKEQSITGVLNPISWDNTGHITRFSVYTEEEEDVIIEDFPNKRKLNKLVNKQVMATGIIRENEYGEKFIKLKKIQELTGPTSPAVNLFKPIDPSIFSEEYTLSIPANRAIHEYGSFDEPLWEAC